MYTLALATLRRNIAFFVVVLAVVVMIEMMMHAVGIVALVFSGLTMLYTHRMIQLNEVYTWSDPLSTKGADGSKIPIAGYILRFVGIFMILMMLMTGAFMTLSVLGFASNDPATSDVAQTILGALIFLPAFACVLGLFGSVLPACAERGDTSLSAAFSRGKATFTQFVPRFMAGPCVLMIVGFVVMGQLEQVVHSETGLIVQGILFAVATCFSLATALLTATALSLSFLTSRTL